LSRKLKRRHYCLEHLNKTPYNHIKCKNVWTNNVVH